MKYFGQASAVLVLLIIQNEATPDSEISNLYSQTHSIRLSLQSYQKHFVEQERRKFDDVAGFHKSEMERWSRSRLHTVGEGRNEDCERTFASKLHEAESSFLMDLEECMNNTIPEWRIGRPGWNTDEILTDLIANGQQLETKIDNVRASCAVNGCVDEQCLEKYLPKLRFSLASYRRSDTVVKRRVQIRTGLGFINFGTCFQQAHDAFPTTTRAAEKEALACIEAN